MQVKYRMIGPSGVIGEIVKDMDGVMEINDIRIESDVYDRSNEHGDMIKNGMDPFELIKAGLPVTWIDVHILPGRTSSDHLSEPDQR